MKQTLLLLLSIFICTIKSDPLTCPSGEEPTQRCASNDDACAGNILCMQLISPPNTGNSYGCCEKSFCEQTGMLSIVGTTLQGVVWKMDSGFIQDNSRWYPKRIHTSSGFMEGACPQPFSFQFSNHGQNVLPADFEIDGKPLKPCTKSSDCKPNQFCGHASSPSYCDEEARLDKFHNNCLDMSNKGKPFMFCYPEPFKENKHIRFKKRRNQVGINLCNNHADCFYHFSNDKMFCMLTENIFNDLDKDDKPSRRNFTGVCVEAAVCRKPTHKDKFASLGIGGSICELGKSETCPGRRSECIASKVTDEVRNVCCELKLDYETPPKNRSGIILHRFSNKTFVDNDVENDDDDDGDEKFDTISILIGAAIGLVINALIYGIYFGAKAFINHSSDKKDTSRTESETVKTPTTKSTVQKRSTRKTNKGN